MTKYLDIMTIMFKKLCVFFLWAVLLVPAAFGSGDSEEDPGSAVSSDYPASGFEEIDLSVWGSVQVHYSPDYRVTVTATPKAHERLEITVKNGRLKIGSRPRVGFFSVSSSSSKITVDVYTPRLEGALVSGSGTIELLDTFTSPSFAADVSGSGAIIGAVNADELSAEIPGSGDIDISGTQKKVKVDISGSGGVVMTGAADDVSIEISGSGSFDGYEFRSASAKVHVSGSGGARLWAEDSLDVRISGSGNVTYRGNPRISFSGSRLLRAEN
jgi:hypothetical protein